MKRVQVTAPDGTPGTVPAEKLAAFQQRGYKPITDASEYADTPMGKLQTGLQGAARGLTFGLSDQLLTESERVGAAQVKKYNPVESTVTDLAGSVVGPAKLLKGASATVEGSLFGLGTLISENALDNRPLTVESVGAAMLASGLTGAGVSKLGDIVSKGVSNVAARASNVLMSEALQKRAIDTLGKVESAVLRDVGASVKGVSDGVDEVLAYAKANKLVGHSPAASVEKAEQFIAKEFESLGGVALRDPAKAKAYYESLKAAGHVDAAEAFAARLKGVAKATEFRDAAINTANAGPAPDYFGNAAKAGFFGFLAGGPKGAMGAAAASVGKDALKKHGAEFGGELLHRGLSKVAEGKLLPKLGEALQARVQQILETAPALLGPFRIALTEAAGRGAADLLTVHASLASGPDGPEYLGRLGIMPDHEGGADRLGFFDALMRDEAERDVMVQKSVKQFFSSEGSAPQPRAPRSFEKDFAAVRDLISSPEKLGAAKGLSYAPGTTVEGGTLAMAAAKHLFDTAPKRDDSWKPVALQKPFNPSKQDIATWYERLEAAKDPYSLARSLATGNVSPKAAETVQLIYPAVFADIRNKVLQELAGQKKPLPYEKRTKLASVFGPEILGVSQQQALLLQSAFSAAKAQSPTPVQGASPDGRQMVNQAKNMQTQIERVSNR